MLIECLIKSASAGLFQLQADTWHDLWLNRGICDIPLAKYLSELLSLLVYDQQRAPCSTPNPPPHKIISINLVLWQPLKSCFLSLLIASWSLLNQSLLTILASCLQWILICIVLSSAGRHTPLFGLCCHGTRCHPACHGTFQTCARCLKVNLDDSTAQYSQKRNVQNELLAYNAVFTMYCLLIYYVSDVTLKCFCYSLMRNWHNTILCCHIVVKLDKMSQSGLIVCCTYTGKYSDRLSFLYIVCEK